MRHATHEYKHPSRILLAIRCNGRCLALDALQCARCGTVNPRPEPCSTFASGQVVCKVVVIPMLEYPPLCLQLLSLLPPFVEQQIHCHAGAWIRAYTHPPLCSSHRSLVFPAWIWIAATMRWRHEASHEAGTSARAVTKLHQKGLFW